MRLSLTLASMLVVALLASCQRYALPQIRDPEQVQKDCALLYQRFPIPTNNAMYATHWRLWIRQQVPKEAWPSSVKAMNPRSVYTDYFGVCISVYENKNEADSANWAERGYYLQFNSRESAPRSADHGLGPFYLKSTANGGIDEFVKPHHVL